MINLSVGEKSFSRLGGKSLVEGKSFVGGKSFSRYRLNFYYWILILILGLSSCTLPGGNQKIPQVKITIRNTLPVQRENVPIVITLDELRKVADDFSFDAYLVVSGQPPVEIHSQADDTNYDGQKDELVFLVDLEPQETKTVTVRYSPQQPDVSHDWIHPQNTRRYLSRIEWIGGVGV